MNDVLRRGAKPLSIAFVSQYFFPEQFSNNAITEELVRRGHSVDVVTGVPNYGQEGFFNGYSNSQRREEEWNGARVHRARTVARGKSKFKLLLNYITFPVTGCWTTLRKIKGRPDVSFVSMPSPPFQALPAIILKWLRGVPVVYWVQDIWPETAVDTLQLKNPLVVRALGALCGWIFRRADMVLVQSAAFPPMIARFGVPDQRIRVLPNTAPQMYQPLAPEDAPEAQALMPDASFRVMFAGNIGESQDFDTLLDTAHLLQWCKGLHWVIIGSGRDLERVRTKAKALGIDTCFHLLGRHPEEAMPGFFAQADALIVSLRNSEIFNRTVPYKIQCYMACGRPIIAAIGGEGARVLADAEAGFTAPASSPRALASAILKLMDLPASEKEAMGTRARRYYDAHYSASQVYGDLEAWLYEAAATQ